MSRLKTKLTRRTLRGSSLCRGCLISHINHSFAKEMSRIISLLSALAAANAFAPVVRPATRAAVRVQVGVPRIDLPAQIVRITASDEPSLTHGCNGTVACSNEQFSYHRARPSQSDGIKSVDLKSPNELTEEERVAASRSHAPLHFASLKPAACRHRLRALPRGAPARVSSFDETARAPRHRADDVASMASCYLTSRRRRAGTTPTAARPSAARC